MEEIQAVPAENDSKRSSTAAGSYSGLNNEKIPGEPTSITWDSRRGTRAFSNAAALFTQPNGVKNSRPMAKISTVSAPSERWLESVRSVLHSKKEAYSLSNVSLENETELETHRF